MRSKIGQMAAFQFDGTPTLGDLRVLVEETSDFPADHVVLAVSTVPGLAGIFGAVPQPIRTLLVEPPVRDGSPDAPQG